MQYSMIHVFMIIASKHLINWLREALPHAPRWLNDKVGQSVACDQGLKIQVSRSNIYFGPACQDAEECRRDSQGPHYSFFRSLRHRQPVSFEEVSEAELLEIFQALPAVLTELSRAHELDLFDQQVEPYLEGGKIPLSVALSVVSAGTSFPVDTGDLSKVFSELWDKPQVS